MTTLAKRRSVINDRGRAQRVAELVSGILLPVNHEAHKPVQRIIAREVYAELSRLRRAIEKQYREDSK